MKFESLAIAFLSSATAFSPATRNRVGSMKAEATLVTEVDEAPRTIYDPLGLYPNDALERATGLIQPFEGSLEQDDKAVIDPLSIYQDKTELTQTVAMSASVPFLQRPEMLDGSLPGDRGFDPFNFSSTPEALQWYRNSELKHARLAMLAAAGWPLAELFHKHVASGFDMQSLLNVQDRVPSVLNGGLSKVPPAFWIATLAASAVIECAANSGEKQSGDFGFDPLGLGGKSEEQKRFMLEAELFNGRLGMLAITGFAIQEWFTQEAVVNAIPIFFKPFNVAFEQLIDAGGNSF